MNIPITKVNFLEEEINAVSEILRTGWIVQGPAVKEFEKKFAEFTGAKFSFAVSNCTNALVLSLIALGIKPGDEVIIPSFTWIATANAVETIGAVPIFCDIDLTSFNIDVKQLEKLTTNKTKAIIPVHLFGLAADMDKIIAAADKYNLLIIEDAACGFGSVYKNKHVGTIGNCGCFSFHPRKSITTGEGGIITTNDKEIAYKIRALRDHGATTSDLQRHNGAKPYLLPEFPFAGYNFRMTDFQAVLGSKQMDRSDQILNERKRIAEIFDDEFKNICWLETPSFGEEYIHSYQSYVCLFQPEELTTENYKLIHTKRNSFMEYLQKKGISTRPGTHSVHNTKYYKKKFNLSETDFVNSTIAEKCSISIPLFQGMKNEEIEYITEVIKNYKV